MLAGNATHLSISKGYVLEPLDQDKLLMTWGLPIETLLLTQIDDRYETTTIKNLNNVSQLTTSKDSIHTAFKLVESQELNRHFLQNLLYFRFTHRSHITLIWIILIEILVIGLCRPKLIVSLECSYNRVSILT